MTQQTIPNEIMHELKNESEKLELLIPFASKLYAITTGYKFCYEKQVVPLQEEVEKYKSLCSNLDSMQQTNQALCKKLLELQEENKKLREALESIIREIDIVKYPAKIVLEDIKSRIQALK